jgi:hypothetical protein
VSRGKPQLLLEIFGGLFPRPIGQEASSVRIYDKFSAIYRENTVDPGFSLAMGRMPNYFLCEITIFVVGNLDIECAFRSVATGFP